MMELQPTQMSLDTSEQINEFVFLVTKTVQQLESMKGITDNRPKTKSALSNALLPLCKVLFLCNVDKVLQNMGKSKSILMYSCPKTLIKYFTVNDLLTKMTENAVRTARKQNRILTLASRGTPVYNLIESQLDNWKKDFSAKSCTKTEHLSSLMNANLMAGDLDPNTVIKKLVKYGLVKIGVGEKVTYDLPDDDSVEASFQELRYRFAALCDWDLKDPDAMKETHRTFKLPVVLYLDNMVLDALILLKKSDDHKPNTVSALKNALKPIQRVLYFVNPKEFLKTLTVKTDVQEKLKTKKRKFSDIGRRNERKAIRFDTRKPAKTSSVSLGNILSTIGFTSHKKTFGGKKVGNKIRKVKQVRQLVNRERTKPSNVSEALQARKNYVQDCIKRAAHLNRMIVLGDDEDIQLKCEQRISKWIQSLNSQGVTDVASAPAGDTASIKSESDTVENMETDMINEPDKKLLRSTTCKLGKAVCAKDILNKLTSLTCVPEELDPSFVIKLLEDFGYCTVHNNQVFYPGIDNHSV